MQNKIINIDSICTLHRLFEYPAPKHPLVSVMDFSKVSKEEYLAGVSYCLNFYSVLLKTAKGSVKYGRGHYDFDEGTMMFTAPNQIIAAKPDVKVTSGWGLFFHPDLLSHTGLGRHINDYSFFNYDSTEALHVSKEERLILEECIRNIENESSQNIDKHTQKLIVSNIELLLNYCDRFYDRQFLTRAKVNNDIVQRFEHLLNEYFAQEALVEAGMPTVKYFSSRLNLSAYYLSDILTKHTGKTTLEHIHLKMIEKAKLLLWSTNKSISEIAYEMGFEHPSHFTKIFKSKAGKTPKAYRSLN